MATYDGDVTLKVTLSPDEVTDTAQTIKKNIEDIFDKTYGKNLSGSFKEAKKQAASLYTQISDLEGKIENAIKTAPPTPEYKKASEEVASYRQEIESLETELQQLATGAGIDLQKLPAILEGYRQARETGQAISAKAVVLQPLDELTKKLDVVKAKLTDTEQTQEHLLKTGNAYDFSKYDDLVMKLSRVNDKAGVANQKLSQLASVEVPPENKFSRLTWNLQKIATFAKTGTKNLISMFKAVGSKIGGGISKLKSFADSIKSVGRQTRSSNNLLQIGFKKLVQYGFGIRTVFLFIKKLRQAIIDGFGSIAQYSAPFNNVISQFVSALGTLKLTLATAFAPIANVVLPLLTGLMDALVDAMNLIGKFFAALTGKSTYIQAKRVNKDYAASLNKTGSSAGNAADGIDSATESAKELQKTIAGFDDVEILHEDKPDTSGKSGGSGGGGGSGSGGGSGLNGADMFETVGIESPIMDFAKKIRDLIANQDWEGLGTFLGECINSIFRKAKDLISWDNLGERITFIVNAITTTFNSLVDAIDWDLIGSTFAEGINTIVRTLNLLLTGINWENLGNGIGTALTALVRDIHWDEVGELFANGLNAAIGFIYGAITAFDWALAGRNLGKAINSFLTKTDWKKAGKTLAEGINGVLTFIYNAMDETDWDLLGSSLTDFLNELLNNVDWSLLGATLSKLATSWLSFLSSTISTFDWSSIGEAIFRFLAGINWMGLLGTFLGSWARTSSAIAQQVVDVLGKAIVEFLGGLYETYIKEPIEEAGGDWVEGLKNGITNALSDLGQWVVDNIFTPFIDAFTSAFQIGSPSKVMEDQGGFIVDGLLNGITDDWPSITEFFGNGLDDILSLILGKNWKETGQETINKVREGVSNKWETVKTFFSTKTDAVIDKFKNSDWKGSGETAINETHTGLSGSWGTITTFFSNGINDVSNDIKDHKWSDDGNTIVSKLRNGINAVWNSEVFNYIKDGIVTIGSHIRNYEWRDRGSESVQKLADGVSGNWYEVTNVFDDGTEEIVNAFDNQDWNGVGENIDSGIQSGINSGWDWVTDTAWNLAEAAFQTAKEALGIASPSKLFKEKVGQMIPAGMAEGIDANSDTAVQAVENLAMAVGATKMPQLQMPDVALGKVIPPETNKNMDTLNESIKNLLDVLQFSQQRAITRDELVSILNTLLPSMLQRYVSFYIGDEQIARHANAGNSSINYRYNPTGD